MIFKKLKEKKIKRNEEKNYSMRYDRIKISKNVTHQFIGGKTGYVIRKVEPAELEDEMRNLNIACCQFMGRREDLCNNFMNYTMDSIGAFCMGNDEGWKKMQDKRRHILKPIVKEKNIEFYYVKVWSNGPFRNGNNGAFYGYVIASDEIDEYISVKNEGRWI